MGIIENLVNNQLGKIIISIIWGLGLSALFRKVCTGRNCIIIKSPDLGAFKDSIYYFDGKCYTFTPKITKCNKK